METTTTKLNNLKLALSERQKVYSELTSQITKMTLLRTSDKEKFLLLGGANTLDGLISLTENAERDIDRMQKEIVELRQLNLFDSHE